MRLTDHRLSPRQRASSRKKSYAELPLNEEPCQTSTFVEFIHLCAEDEKQMEIFRQMLHDNHQDDRAAEYLFESLQRNKPSSNRDWAELQIADMERFFEQHHHVSQRDKMKLRYWYTKVVKSWTAVKHINRTMFRLYLQPREVYISSEGKNKQPLALKAREMERDFHQLVQLDMNISPRLEEIKKKLSNFSPTLMFEEIAGSRSKVITTDDLSSFLGTLGESIPGKLLERALRRISGNMRADKPYSENQMGVTLEEWRSYLTSHTDQPLITRTVVERTADERTSESNQQAIEYLVAYLQSLQKLEDIRCELANREDFVPLDAFKLADKHRRMFLTQQDVHSFLCQLGVTEQLDVTVGTVRFMVETFDVDGDGVLDSNDFKHVFLPLDGVQRAQMLNTDNKYKISSILGYSRPTRSALVRLFLTVMIEEEHLEQLRRDAHREGLVELFRWIDVKNKGKSGLRDISQFLQTHGTCLSGPQLRLLLAQFDKDFGGYFSLSAILNETAPRVPDYYNLYYH